MEREELLTKSLSFVESVQHDERESTLKSEGNRLAEDLTGFPQRPRMAAAMAMTPNTAR